MVLIVLVYALVLALVGSIGFDKREAKRLDALRTSNFCQHAVVRPMTDNEKIRCKEFLR